MRFSQPCWFQVERLDNTAKGLAPPRRPFNHNFLTAGRGCLPVPRPERRGPKCAPDSARFGRGLLRPLEEASWVADGNGRPCFVAIVGTPLSEARRLELNQLHGLAAESSDRIPALGFKGAAVGPA